MNARDIDQAIASHASLERPLAKADLYQYVIELDQSVHRAERVVDGQHVQRLVRNSLQAALDVVGASLGTAIRDHPEIAWIELPDQRFPNLRSWGAVTQPNGDCGARVTIYVRQPDPSLWAKHRYNVAAERERRAHTRERYVEQRREEIVQAIREGRRHLRESGGPDAVAA